MKAIGAAFRRILDRAEYLLTLARLSILEIVITGGPQIDNVPARLWHTSGAGSLGHTGVPCPGDCSGREGAANE